MTLNDMVDEAIEQVDWERVVWALTHMSQPFPSLPVPATGKDLQQLARDNVAYLIHMLNDAGRNRGVLDTGGLEVEVKVSKKSRKPKYVVIRYVLSNGECGV